MRSLATTLLRRGACAAALVLACAPVFSVEAEKGTPWARLTPAQQQALTPLQRDWSSIDTQRKQKWLELSERMPKLPADERQRIQARMTEWARMTPAERAGARAQFQETRQLTADERQASWLEYQALPDDQRRQLAQQAKPVAAAAAAANKPAIAAAGNKLPSAATPALAAAASPSLVGTQLAGGAKNNVVGVRPSAPAHSATPTVVQPKPGATTTTVATRPSPPVHSQTGLPKIAATPDFVDRATLLPKRGPQAAAKLAASASSPDTDKP